MLASAVALIGASGQGVRKLLKNLRRRSSGLPILPCTYSTRNVAAFCDTDPQPEAAAVVIRATGHRFGSHDRIRRTSVAATVNASGFV